MPENFAETSTGLLLMANGLDPMLRWDGFTDQAELAGVAAPTTAPGIIGGGAGDIVGTYYAYVRFRDRAFNYSNLSPISVAYDAQGDTGDITGASNATPIVITSSAHGLTTGTKVKITGVGGNTSANNTWTITVIDADNFSLDNSHGTADYTGSGLWTSGVSTITYTSVPIPTDPKITTREILRNTDGQTDTFYVDIETADLTSTTFTSTLNDTLLAAGLAVPILDAKGGALANRFDVPPADKAAVAQHLDRMFAAVSVPYSAGSCRVAQGSLTVRGVGTEWTAPMAGRYLSIIGAKQGYLIDTVNVAAQTLTLTETYKQPTDNFALYSIHVSQQNSRLVQYSEAGLPEAWPPINALSLSEDGDVITGLMSKSSFLYILERNHVYRVTFQTDPALDGAVFLSAVRGCLNQRCFVVVEDIAYMLDAQGVHAFGANQGSEPISAPIQELFRPNSVCPYRINWKASDFFHAVHYLPQETIRWFIALSGEYLPRHALCYNYRMKHWWIEQFTVPIGGSAAGYLGGQPRVFLGSACRRVLAFWEGSLDGADAAAGTVRGNVTSSTAVSLSDSIASFAAAHLVGSPICIVAGLGKGQVRQIVSVVGAKVTVDNPWLIQPDTTSVYQIGGIQWNWKSGWFRFVQSEEDTIRRLEAVFQPVQKPATMDLRVSLDFSETPVDWGSDKTSEAGAGIATQADDPNLVVDLTKRTGIAQERFDGHKEFYIDGGRFIQIEARGFSTEEQQAVYEFTIDGAVSPGGGK